MEDKLAIIRRIIEEHQTIRGHVKLVGDSTSDREALNALTRARVDWIPGRPDIVSEKLKRVQQTISALDEGLRTHFAFEEKYLPQLLGQLLMQALAIEHQEIREQIDEAKSIVANTRIDGLSREDLLSEESHIHETVSAVTQAVAEHAGREEVLLDMLRRALEEKG